MTMTERLRTENHNTYYGTITAYDFEGYMSIKNMAERIVSDWKFDSRCRKAVEQRGWVKK